MAAPPAAAAAASGRKLTEEEEVAIKLKAKEALIKLTVEWDNPDMALWVLERYEDIGEDGNELDAVLDFALEHNRISFIRWLLKMPTFRCVARARLRRYCDPAVTLYTLCPHPCFSPHPSTSPFTSPSPFATQRAAEGR